MLFTAPETLCSCTVPDKVPMLTSPIVCGEHGKTSLANSCHSSDQKLLPHMKGLMCTFLLTCRCRPPARMVKKKTKKQKTSLPDSLDNQGD